MVPTGGHERASAHCYTTLNEMSCRQSRQRVSAWLVCVWYACGHATLVEVVQLFMEVRETFVGGESSSVFSNLTVDPLLLGRACDALGSTRNTTCMQVHWPMVNISGRHTDEKRESEQQVVAPSHLSVPAS